MTQSRQTFDRPSLTPGLPGGEVPLSRLTQELAVPTPELGVSLQVDQAEMRASIIAWQQMIRYFAIGGLALLSLVFGDSIMDAVVPVVGISLAYIACVRITARLAERTPDAVPVRLPALLVTADVTTLSAFCYLTSPPDGLYRILVLGLLIVPLAVFYFGVRLGVIAATLTAGAYLVATQIVPPFVEGPRPGLMNTGFDSILFGIVATVVIYTFGHFRTRLDALRMYCKLVEEGEGGTLPRIGMERNPDDLTLLARSFETMRRRLSDQIGSDPLTGCLNRRALERRLRAEFRRAKRRGTAVAVAAIDIDHFKEINDTYGHPVGDLVLQQISGVMLATARDTDAVARLGGDEFVVVLPDTVWEGATKFAERLRERVSEGSLGPIGAPVPVTISVGVALVQGEDAPGPDDIIREADRALYRAKTAGRNRVAV